MYVSVHLIIKIHHSHNNEVSSHLEKVQPTIIDKSVGTHEKKPKIFEKYTHILTKPPPTTMLINIRIIMATTAILLATTLHQGSGEYDYVSI